jgi:hypothetical protein
LEGEKYIYLFIPEFNEEEPFCKIPFSDTENINGILIKFYKSGFDLIEFENEGRDITEFTIIFKTYNGKPYIFEGAPWSVTFELIS